MKKILLLVALTMALFSYDNNSYYNPNPDVVSLYCKVTSMVIKGQLTHFNDRNRKQYGVDKYFQFIKTRSWFYPVGDPNNKSLFSHSERMPGMGTNMEIYTNNKSQSQTVVARESEYKYHLVISVYNVNTPDMEGTVQYDCTTNPR